MATRDQLMQALRAADAAGNTADAQQLANSIKALGAPAAAPPQQGALKQTDRALGWFGTGFNDSAAEYLGALPDLINRGVKAATGYEIAPQGYYANGIKAGLSAIGMGPPEGPRQGWIEKGAYGAGRGVADAASVAIPATAIARGARAASLTGRVATALAGQPAAQVAAGAAGGGVGEATNNPLLGLAASLTVPLGSSGLRRAVSPVANQLTPEQARLAAVAQAEGITLTPGQATGSRPLQTAESVLGTLPLSGGMARRGQQAQREAFNAAVLRSAGINSNTATPPVLDAGRQALGNEFTQLAAQTTVPLDHQFLTDLQATVQDYTRKLPSQTRPVFHAYVNDILNAANGPDGMPGTVYQTARSDLGRQAKALANSDPTLSRALRGLRDSLDAAADRNIPANLRDRWQTARQQYGNYKVIERAMSSPGIDAAAGNIPPAQIWSGVKAQNGTRMAAGQGDLNDLARVGQAFIKPQIPNSGTSERQWMTNILTGGLPVTGAMVGGTTGAIGGMAAAGASTAMPPLVQYLMNSPAGRAWLTNQVGHNVPGPRSTAGLLSAITAARGKDSLLSRP